MSVTVNSYSPIQDYVHPDYHSQPSYALSIILVLCSRQANDFRERKEENNGKGREGEKKFQRELLIEPSPISALYFSLSVLLYLSTFGMICM